MYRPQHYADTTKGKKVMSTKTKSNKPKVVINSALCSDVKTAFRILRDTAGVDYIKSEWNGGNSMAVSLPDGYQAFIAKLPADQDHSIAVRMFNQLENIFRSLYGESKVSIIAHRGYLQFGARCADCTSVNA